MKQLFLFFILCIFSAGILSQDKGLFIPKEIRQAYDKGTRSTTGAPGSHYFQNHSDYDIEAKFDPETGIIRGFENITYTNNSPDTLQQIAIRLYMNLFRKGMKRDFRVSA